MSRAPFSRQNSRLFPSVSRPNLISEYLINIFPFCSSPTRENRSPTGHGSKKSNRTFYLFHLKACTSSSIVSSVQAHAFKSGFQCDLIISTALLNSLANFCEASSARKLFDEMQIRDEASWNAMLSVYVRNGSLHLAQQLFQLMFSSFSSLNSVTLSILLQFCSNFEDQLLGRSIHGFAFRHLELRDTFLDNSLIVYYNKFDDLKASEFVFKSMLRRDTVSWNAMISGFIMSTVPWKALELLCVMMSKCLNPDLITLEMALQACSRIGQDAIFNGMLIHGLLIRFGFNMDIYAENCLLIMYCKCGMAASGQSLFERMETRNAVSWNIIINGYILVKCPRRAFDLFLNARKSDAKISSDSFVSAFQAVRLIGGQRELVMSLNGLVVKLGFDSDIYICSSIISAYGDSGNVESARSLLVCSLAERNQNTIVLWNSMLSVYLNHRYFSEAAELIGMNYYYDAVSIVNILSLCISILGLKAGKAVHGYIIRKMLESDVFIFTSVLKLYISYGVLPSACRIFSLMPCRNIVSWNTMIIGCARLGMPCMSLKLFYDMQQKDGFMPDAISVMGAIEAIALRNFKVEEEFIHNYALMKGFIDNEFVATSLISMHSRFQNFCKVELVFDRASKLSMAIWNAMIAECSHLGLMDIAISYYCRMMTSGIALDSGIMLCLLQCCIASASLYAIALFHAVIFKSGYEADVYVASTLINAYSKCGDLRLARQVFDNMAFRTVVSWNSMILGYGIHGDVQEADKLFMQMQGLGLVPTAITFLILISACNHTGYLEKGLYYIDIMTESYSLHLRNEHISSIIGLVARRGLTKEVNELLEKMPSDPGVSTWGAFVGACRVDSDFKFALTAAQKLFTVYTWHQGHCTLLPNILAESGRWIEASIARSRANAVGFKKEKAWSKVER